MKTTKLVLGILSIRIFVFVLFQSSAAGIALQPEAACAAAQVDPRHRHHVGAKSALLLLETEHAARHSGVLLGAGR